MALKIKITVMTRSRKKLEILVSFGFWIVIGVLIGLTSYFQMIQKGYSCGFFATIGEQVLSILPWGLYSLIILWLVRKFPTGVVRGSYRIHLIHLPVAFLIAGFHCTVTSLIWWLTSGIPRNEPLQDYFSYIFLGRIILHLIIYAAMLFVCYALTYYEKYQKERNQVIQLEKLLAESRLDALKTQLQPHFLFNTLNTISMLIRKKDEQSATSIVAKLAELLRYVLENRDVHLVELRKEIRFIEHYLAIESMRFQDRLSYRIVVEPEAEKALIPDLILQPVVENAIRHGIGEKPEGGQVEVLVRCQGDCVEIRIHDNGIGYPNHRSGNRGEGIGLKNIRERLDTLYGEEASFTITGRTGQGTTVVLRIPIT